MGRAIGGHQLPHRGATDEWLTPPEIFGCLGEFDLDPCSPVNRPWPTAAKHYTIDDDGLSKKWEGRVWLNPPYGPETGKWLARLANHRNGIALIFARTETAMFFRHVWRRADALRFIEGRLHFHHPDGHRAKGNAAGPSVLVAYGKVNVENIEFCMIPGQFIRLRGDR